MAGLVPESSWIMSITIQSPTRRSIPETRLDQIRYTEKYYRSGVSKDLITTDNITDTKIELERLTEI